MQVLCGYDQVVNGEGSVSGLLSIAKCLYDAIHRLDKKAMRDEENRSSSGNQELAASLLKVSRYPGNYDQSYLVDCSCRRVLLVLC